jgi:hypothetical protein
MLGVPEGHLPFQGQGDGSFVARPIIGSYGCHGRNLATGDFNRDGKGDLVAFCDSVIAVSINEGNGIYRKSLDVKVAGFTPLSSAIEDLNGDGLLDLAFTRRRINLGYREIAVYRGKGDGSFAPEVVFAGAGFGTSYLIASDLDGDAHPDLVSADASSSMLTVMWGRGGERILDYSVSTVTGFTRASAVEAGDLDRDGRPDLFVSIADRPEVKVYLNPGSRGALVPDLAINLPSTFSSLQVSDLEGDGGPDLAGVNRAGGTVYAVILEQSGRVRAQAAKPAGLFPWSILAGRLDEGETPDLAAPSTASAAIAIFSGEGDGAFSDAIPLSSIDKPRRLAAMDLDGDGRRDLAAMSLGVVAVQYGQAGDVPFAAAIPVLKSDQAFSDLTAADLDADGRPELLASDLKGSVRMLGAAPGRTFVEGDRLALESPPTSLAAGDLDGDGLTDVVAASSDGHSVAVFVNRGSRRFADRVEYLLGFGPLGLILADLDVDGALDLLAYQGNIAAVLPGLTTVPAGGGFIRGDAGADGRVEITDPILILDRLFLGGASLPCEDGADANDDGELDLADAIAVLERLFLGGAPLPPPGPEACGEDPTPDRLSECKGGC